MKIKRQKTLHRTLLHYKNFFSLEPPFNILLDGTFCKAALSFKINIADQLPKYLDCEVKIKTTQCVIRECKSFGPLLFGPWKVLQQFEVEPCKHRDVSGAVCLRRMAKKNKKFMIATQDPQLTKVVRSLPGVPLLYISHKAINLEKPSKASQEESELPAEDKELERLKEMKKAILGEEEASPVVTKKRKKPKGPNPLSRKKKKSAATQPIAEKEGKRKRSRKRRKRNPQSPTKTQPS
ncbi:hypothetical protein CAPTEDRAFT_180172 [Capitella teleta]|uniref:rRNA-processing protein UTP23 homolog n=1 Tax=Capitella teleta TaxID=283909 RepID=N1PB45_CAPTE|nr:hypothetical protein CAPTEDRAFT_180172 [Capitella teleta]|eukprot:ELU18872.1 hypothetical protein CAPTEDRAFT_180172 [Capitella teleta]